MKYLPLIICILLQLVYRLSFAQRGDTTPQPAIIQDTIQADTLRIELQSVDTTIAINTVAQDLETDTLNGNGGHEDAFQDYLDSLYHDNYSTIDTFAWDNYMINSGHFNSAEMPDTVFIPLMDSSGKTFFVFPFKNRLSYDFGPRRIYIWHYGVDIKLNTGDSVKAAMDGIVRLTKYERRGYGRVVVIRHAHGLETIYGHLSKGFVTANQEVKAGEVIGLGGNTGRSTGSHLHFEIRYYGEPFNPNDFMDFTTFELKSDTLALSKANFEYLVELRKAKYHTIRSGDTLSGIAVRYHTTVSKICSLNNMTRNTILRIGRKIRYQ